MGIDELEDENGCASNNEPQASAPVGSSTVDDDKGARVDAAKAFFRAMYAGEEPPVAFGEPVEEKMAPSGVCRNCEGLEMSLREAEQKSAESESLYKRMAADFENYRRRMDREREESVSTGVKKAAESVIPALDDLDRAMSFLSADTPADKVIESFKLVANRIFACLEQIGVKPMTSVGQVFDPKFHEPVQQVETTEHADGTVMQELRRGYMLYDKVVRPALVNVASNASGVVQPAATVAPVNGAASASAEAKVSGGCQQEKAESAVSELDSGSDAAKGAGKEESSQCGAGAGEMPNPRPEASAEEGEALKVYDLGDIDV